MTSVALTSPTRSDFLVISWWALFAGLAALYVPTYLDVYRVFWHRDHDTAGFVVLATSIGLLAYRFTQLPEREIPSTRASHWLGLSVLILGLLIYWLGRSQTIYQLQVVSTVPVLLGLVTSLLRAPAAKRLLIPILLLLFTVPVPGSVMDELLLPLKQWVSQWVAWLLYEAGYPVGRNGVTISIGPYDLLIADACSGLNSLVALSGIGAAYLYMTHDSSVWRKGVLLAAIVPIAVLSNLLRVIALVLITYYGGDRNGRLFHSNMGFVEVVVAYLLFFSLDRALAAVPALSARKS